MEIRARRTPKVTDKTDKKLGMRKSEARPPQNPQQENQLPSWEGRRLSRFQICRKKVKHSQNRIY
jgi:hypothetical protein